ncbi:MAG: GNAT family N-acetyltransferase [Candidatus Desulforudis sp.]|nr:GNAT family N-acetyltransferase [Desulforudis sp.]
MFGFGKGRLEGLPDGIPRRVGDCLVDRLRPRDLIQVARLEAESFPEPLSFRALLRLWLMPVTHYIVIRKKRKVIAYIGFQMFGPAAHTISMCIHPDHRRRGLGKLIQQTADGIAKGLGAYWFTGEVRVSNTAQIKMLEGLGWETVGVCPNFFKNGETAVVMWNRLCK